ncbi:MAG: VCBS repeat-containing protein [Planctomycetes bacterium]|nr:VCBS repeat-containing protein [Planctomycetota bacterium]
MKTKSTFLLTIIVLSFAVSGAAAPVSFKKIVIDKTFRAEGVATADINHDGKLDILSGDLWYSSPGWKMHELRPVGTYDGTKGYSNCFTNFAQDVNGDGWVDSIIIGYPGDPCWWYENPRNKPGHWKQRMIAKSACNETPIFVDLLGNGRPVPIFAVRPEGIMAWFGIPKDLDGLWDMHVIAAGPDAPGTKKYSHGLGAGDVNGDGRCDVLVKEGWWQAPEDRTKKSWKFHPANLGPDCANILVYDVDNDGDSDVITSSAHRYGIWWFEQDGSEFKQHVIFDKYSQAHAIILADINSDGIKDLVTGKRHFAHQGKDPGGHEPAMLYWFELRRPEKAKPVLSAVEGVEFVLHVIDDNSGVGTQFEVVDMNADGKLDIVTSNKKGVHIFLQQP